MHLRIEGMRTGFQNMLRTANWLMARAALVTILSPKPRTEIVVQSLLNRVKIIALQIVEALNWLQPGRQLRLYSWS
jgi:hypothetical protein